MKIINLKSGFKILLDDEDFDLVKGFKWHAAIQSNNYYARTGIKNKDGKWERIEMHRMIMGCSKGDGKIVDHKDRNTLNNQKSNLRFCTIAENVRNRTPRNGRKYLGVRLNKQNTWTASIGYKYKTVYLGVFKSEIEAAKAYDKAAKEYHGEFANLNLKS